MSEHVRACIGKLGRGGVPVYTPTFASKPCKAILLGDGLVVISS